MPLPRKFTHTARASKSKPKPVEKRVLANRYTVVRKLGSGNFGTAWIIQDGKAKDDRDRIKAVKEIPVGDLLEDDTLDAVHEASLLRNLDHPGVVKFHDSFVDGEFFCIVTEFCEGGDLDQKIADARNKKRTIPEAQVMEWLIQLLLALQYMHDRRVLHRDLKARNIFLRNNVIKVGDFGISRILMGTAEMASTFVGTPYYMSPEVLKHEGYNSKSDVWSIGCIVYEMCALKHAFEGQSLMGVMYKIVEGNLPDWPTSYSQDLKEVFENLLIKDPAKRPSASEALKLQFIARQMELLKNTMMDKHHHKEQRENIRTDSQQLWEEMRKKTKLDQLRRESEEQKWKNMSPRERMRLKKQQVADENGKKLRVVALQQQMDNKMKYEEIKRNNDPYETHFDFKGKKEEVERKKGPAFTDYRAMENSLITHHGDNDSDNSEDDTDEEAGTIVERKRTSTAAPPPPATAAAAAVRNSPTKIPRPMQSGSKKPIYSLSKTEKLKMRSSSLDEPASSTSTLLPQARTYGEFSHTFHAEDERPITPMKNRMVYDVEHSSLDFDDGVPTSPDLADTYYSQFQDFEKDDDDDDDDDDGSNKQRGRGDEDNDDDNDDEGTLVPGDEDVEDLINCMKNALDQSDTLKSETLTDITSAFGPVVRETKIKNLKLEAISKLGEDDFNRAYAYLKEMRFGGAQRSTVDSGSTCNENSIMRNLAKMVRNPNDCFIVDQLLFLEAQAEIL